MGYTHYFSLSRRDDLRVEEIGSDIIRLVEASDVPICDAWGEVGTQPEFTSEMVAFNGIGEDGYESFVYPPDFDRQEKHGLVVGASFCKTDRRPYDEVVAATLLVLKYHLGNDMRIGSDGNISDEEWQRAIALFQRAFPNRNVEELFFS